MYRNQNTGFSLIELMVVISVLAIFVSFALPAFNSVIEGNRVSSTANQFQALLMSARSDAVTRRSPVTITQNDSVWSTADRQLTIPDSVKVTPNKTTITFNPDGTATESSTILANEDESTSYTIETKLVGLIKKTQD